MIRATSINKSYEVEFDPSYNNAAINGEAYKIDLSRESGHRFHLLRKNKSWNLEITDIDRTLKLVRLKVNGRAYEIKLKDRFDDLLLSLGMESSENTKNKDVKAPMPGMVLNILVGEGELVEKDAPLVILEAMKMENVIKSPAAGSIKRIGVKKGVAVEKNTILIEFA
jgi:biotin carboxyl carrier protein